MLNTAAVDAAQAPAALRIAGVPEAFNDPFERADFAGAIFVSHPGGSGAMVASVENGAVDAAFVLTECAVAAVARGADLRLVAPVVASPLTWGVVARAGTAGGGALQAAAWAVSRRGSGSDVMARVLARRRGWEGAPRAVVECGTFDRMAAAVRDASADAFLWERSTTRGLLRASELDLAIVDAIAAPWPAFCCVVRTGFARVLDVRAAVDAFAAAAALWHADTSTVGAIVDRHAMTEEEAREWLAVLRFAAPGELFDLQVLSETRDALVHAGVIAAQNAAIDMADYIAV